jgi:hypothetical protein
MARRNGSSGVGQVEPDRVARMGGRRGPEPTVRGQLARRMKAHGGTVRSTARVRPAGLLAGPNGPIQRVVVKSRVSRHQPGRARAGLTRHVTYLGRETASRDGGPGTFYAADRDVPRPREEVGRWADDRHHFRLIVSPERDVPDLTAYVRTVMATAERDLGTRLDWTAVNHHDTDNPHAHVMVRGRLPDGRDLVIPRRYLAHDLRQRAAEAATELLGPPAPGDAQRTADPDAQVARFTWLDRAIGRHLEGGRIDVSADRQLGTGADDRRAVVARLQYLATAGLAHKEEGTWWRLEPDFKEVLRDLGGLRWGVRGAQLDATGVPVRAADVPGTTQLGGRTAPAGDGVSAGHDPPGGSRNAAGSAGSTRVRTLPQGGSVAGTYAGVERASGGTRLLVSTDDGVYAVPVLDAPAVTVGTAVDVRRTAAGTVVELASGRGSDRGAQRTADELEAGR